MENLDVYYSFRSPYSYLSTPDLLRLKSEYDLSIRLRVVLPIAVRSSEFFRPQNIRWAKYIQLDWERRAEFLGLPHRWPDPDPIVQDLETFQIASEQPYIFRISMLGVEAERRGKGVEFAYEVSGLIFGGTKNWNRKEYFDKAIERAGLDPDQVEAEITNGTHMDEIEQNQQALDVCGHWGVPTFVFRNEPFFGQDRIDLLRWTLAKSGVSKR